jgi:ribosomal protein S18 acetylase RimI-like enzyme
LSKSLHTIQSSEIFSLIQRCLQTCVQVHDTAVVDCKMDVNATIRHGEPRDAETIAFFNVSMAKETENIDLDPPTVKRGVQAVFEVPARGRYFVAEIDNHVVGCLMITYEWSDWRCKDYWYIQSVFVLPEFRFEILLIFTFHRRKKVFRTLYEHVRTLARKEESKCAALRLYVDTNNDRARKTYESLGMTTHYSLYEESFV